MDDLNFEGSEILERLNEINQLEEFYQAVDSDDLSKVRQILSAANIESEIINQVIQKIESGED